ncbi:hypothetical protein ACSBR2_009265 [Camellia fascicularis]
MYVFNKDGDFVNKLTNLSSFIDTLVDFSVSGLFLPPNPNSNPSPSLQTMNANYKIMNIDGNFRFITKSLLNEFRVWADWYCVGNSMKSLCDGLGKPKDLYRGLPLAVPNLKQEISDGVRARVAALRPEGPISSRFLANNLTIIVVGDSVFVHGCLLPNHVDYGLDRINEEGVDWISGLKESVSKYLITGRN